jgi:hypothetical protein
MRLGRCPVCHAHLHLDALVQDEAGRDLLALFATIQDDLGRALVGYLTLFRPAKSDLSNARALRLAREVLALEADPGKLAWALCETVESLRAKGESRAIKNHNYLRRVLENAPAIEACLSRAERRMASTKTEAAMLALEAMKRGS